MIASVSSQVLEDGRVVYSGELSDSDGEAVASCVGDSPEDVLASLSWLGEFLDELGVQ